MKVLFVVAGVVSAGASQMRSQPQVSGEEDNVASQLLGCPDECSGHGKAEEEGEDDDEPDVVEGSPDDASSWVSESRFGKTAPAALWALGRLRRRRSRRRPSSPSGDAWARHARAAPR